MTIVGRKYIYLYKINCVDFLHIDNKLNHFGTSSEQQQQHRDAAFEHLFAFITFIILIFFHFGSRYSAEKRNSIPPIEL